MVHAFALETHGYSPFCPEEHPGLPSYVHIPRKTNHYQFPHGLFRTFPITLRPFSSCHTHVGGEKKGQTGSRTRVFLNS